MYKIYENRLRHLKTARTKELFQERKIGLEKESLRVQSKGGIAQTPHPVRLGSALTNPYITTDYSESLIEFITPPFSNSTDVIEFLKHIHKFVYPKIDNEILWATSMPCVLAGESSIEIANYGRSNAGMMKTIYRRGLGHRYGRIMQVIAGVHFNYSLPMVFWNEYQHVQKDKQDIAQFTSQGYFDLIRNMLRIGWIVPYLFGASPAICKSFFKDKKSTMPEFNDNTFYEPYATSLRMGDIGYQNRKEAETGIKANYNSLHDYIKSLQHAIETPCTEYEKIGVLENGEYKQLNSNILQIENEYYSTIRPKQITQMEEKPIHALRNRGVQYVELRSLDVNAFEPMGLDQNQLSFIEALLCFALLNESAVISQQEHNEIDENLALVAHRGRDPDVKLWCRGQPRSLREWGLEICDAMSGVCELLDSAFPDGQYSHSLSIQKKSFDDPDLTPSARMLREMKQNSEGFFDFAMRMSHQHKSYFDTLAPSEFYENLLNKEAMRSIERQHHLEEADDLSLEAFLQRYFSKV